MIPQKPIGNSPKARFDRWKYEVLTREPSKSVGVLTTVTTRGTFRRPMPRRPAPTTEPPFRAIWHFTPAGSRVRIQETIDVEGGFAFNITSDEKALFAANDIQGALDAEDSGATDAQQPNMVQSKIYPASVRSLRFRCQSSAPFEGTQQEFVFVRILELPIKEQLPEERGYGRLALRHVSDISSDGFHVFEFLTSECVIIPNSSVLAIITPRGDLLKPRPTWGGTAFSLRAIPNNAAGNATGRIIFNSSTPTIPVLQSTFPRYNTPSEPFQNYFLTKNARFITWNGDNRSDLTQDGLGGFIGSIRRTCYTITFSRIPNDGEEITVGADTRTWKNTVSDPTLEIEIGAAIDESVRNLASHLEAYPIESFRASVVSATKALIMQGSYIISTAPVLAVDEWATLSRFYMHGETIWRPSPAADWVGTVAGVRNPTTIRHPEWMAIKMNEEFDQTIALPTMENPFILQAFIAAPVFTDLPLETTAKDITLTVSRS